MLRRALRSRDSPANITTYHHISPHAASTLGMKNIHLELRVDSALKNIPRGPEHRARRVSGLSTATPTLSHSP